MKFRERVRKWWRGEDFPDIGNMAPLADYYPYCAFSYDKDGVLRVDAPKGKFEIFEDRAGEWRWRLKAANRKIVAQSEGYTRKRDAERSCEAVRRAAYGASVVDA